MAANTLRQERAELAAVARGLPQAQAAGAPRIAVLIPCHDEAAAIAGTVDGFRAALPNAAVYVYDNNSTDETCARAEAAGAIVRSEPRQGKGNVVRRMFRDVDADIYVLVDGDMTYDADAAARMIDKLTIEGLDLVTGERVDQAVAAYRPGHRLGNRMLTGSIRLLFGADTKDMLSGYRVMSRRFVKSFPTASDGFEIETELTVHALEIGAPTAEVPTAYSERPEGSLSKLNTIKDGVRIALTIATLFQRERPLHLFGALGLLAITLGAALLLPVLSTYVETGLVPRLPSLIAAAAMGLTGMSCLFAGAILASLSQGRREMKRLFYLQHDAINGFSSATR